MRSVSEWPMWLVEYRPLFHAGGDLPRLYAQSRAEARSYVSEYRRHGVEARVIRFTPSTGERFVR